MTKQSALDIYYCFGAISIVCTLYVIGSIFVIGHETSPCRLVLYLHLTVLVENITTLPAVYTEDASLCAFLGFLRIYFGFANVIVLFMIVFHYRYIFIIDTLKLKEFVNKRREMIIFISPLISLLPFSTDGYGEYRSIWCSIKEDGDMDDMWSYVVYFGWILAIVGISALLMLHTIIQVYMADTAIAGSLVMSMGFYAVVAMLSWLPRALGRFGVIDPINANIFLYFSSIAYCIIFQLEKESLRKFEENARITFADQSENGSVYFSWQFDSTFFRSSSKSHSETSSNPRSSLGKKGNSPSFHSRSFFSRSFHRIGTLVRDRSGSKGHPLVSPSEVSSAHTSGNRGEMAPISPIPEEGEVHNIILESSPDVTHHNRPISANLMKAANVPESYQTTSLAESHAITSAEQANRKSDVINYHGIARYNMNVDESLKRPVSHRPTPSKGSTQRDIEVGRDPNSVVDEESKRPSSLRLHQGDTNKRPTSLRLNVMKNNSNGISNSQPSSYPIDSQNTQQSASDENEVKSALVTALLPPEESEKI